MTSMLELSAHLELSGNIVINKESLTMEKPFSREESRAKPEIYVPRGYIPLKSAIVATAQKLYPDAPLADYLQNPGTMLATAFDSLRTPDTYDPFCDAPQNQGDLNARMEDKVRVLCFVGLQNARTYLRAALAEKEITATGQTPSGKLVLIKPAYWRTDHGGWRLIITDRIDAYTQIFIEDVPFEDWIANFDPDKDDTETDDLPTESRRVAHSVVLEALKERLATQNGKNISKGKHFEAIRMLTGAGRPSFNRAWAEITALPEYEQLAKPGRKPRPGNQSP
ncbi:hypothetical protein [Gluconobacter japonicus]|uniref:hypothetical protein n=1 Tax=Gluconobacter japonicus TaxID=376620 RepID=UPI000781BE0A|nr:hypothetical protein [Gluconobacter japonicus]KXV20418.1 hypothetical protein AD935_11995 [Gluconobacter japonicus]